MRGRSTQSCRPTPTAYGPDGLMSIGRCERHPAYPRVNPATARTTTTARARIRRTRTLTILACAREGASRGSALVRADQNPDPFGGRPRPAPRRRQAEREDHHTESHDDPPGGPAGADQIR